MSKTIPLKKEDVGNAKTAEEFLAGLSDKYEGKWVVIRPNGDVAASTSLNELLSGGEATEIACIFHAAKKGAQRL